MLEDNLRNLIEERFGSVRQFAINVNMPYTTIRSILQRGIANSGASNIMCICMKLNIDPEELIKGNIVIARPRNFSADEVSIVGSYRELNEEAQGMAKSYIKYLESQPQYKKHSVNAVVEGA